jgi:uncharacterized metal-binding protein YceD (DUF177 family)
MNEFSRPFRLDSVASEPGAVEIEAGPAEREALARRFELVGIEALTAAGSLVRRGESIEAAGTIRARVTQSCVATAEPVDSAIEETFRIEFRPLPEAGSAEEEIELGENELDVVFSEGAEIDLGEAVAQTLLLALDPYPRSPAAEAALSEAGVKSEEEARAESSPFAALAALKGKLEE